MSQLMSDHQEKKDELDQTLDNEMNTVSFKQTYSSLNPKQQPYCFVKEIVCSTTLIFCFVYNVVFFVSRPKH